MVNNRKKSVCNIVLLVCALLFGSLEALHSLVHHHCGQYTDSLMLLAQESPATFYRRQDANPHTLLLLSPVCVERFVAIADHIAFFDLIAEPVSVYYPRALVVFVTAIISYSSRAPPYAYHLFAK